MNNYLKNTFENKKILILGMGREGKSTLDFLNKNFSNKNFSNLDISTADQKNGENYLDNLKNFDVIVKSPGIPWKLDKIQEALKAGVKFTSQTQIFLDLFKNQTIGITGTKGKSTTSSLIYHILKSSGKDVKLIGNIGKPALDFIENANKKTLFVYELSSFHLTNINVSPHIAILLNIFPEHLDYYESLEDYFNAKANITKFQDENDIFIYCSDFQELNNIAQKSKAKKFNFSTNDKLESYKTNLLGKHNLNNIKAAILVCKSLDINDREIKNGIENFVPLDDRLQTIRIVNNILFVDDSLATIPQATIAALESFENKNITLILGGFDRGIDFEILGKDLKKRKNVLNIILIGQTANKIEEVLVKNNFSGKIYNLGITTMNKIVKLAHDITPKNGIVLLSPAATSFDMFKDYKDRAEQFKKYVSKI